MIFLRAPHFPLAPKVSGAGKQHEEKLFDFLRYEFGDMAPKVFINVKKKKERSKKDSSRHIGGRQNN